MKTIKFIIFTLVVISSFIACGEKPIIEIKDGTYRGVFDVKNNEGEYIFGICGLQALVEINNNNTMNFTMKSVKFTEEMPAIDMKVMGVITEKSKDRLILSLPKDEIIPVDGEGVLLPQYKITELEGFITIDHLRFSMLCGEYYVSFWTNILNYQIKRRDI